MNILTDRDWMTFAEIAEAIQKYYEHTHQHGQNCGKYVSTSTIAYWSKIPRTKVLRFMKKLNSTGKCLSNKYSGIYVWYIEIDGWEDHPRWSWCVVPKLIDK